MRRLKILHISCVDNEQIGGVGFVVPKYIEYQSKYAETALYDIKNTYIKSKISNRFTLDNYNSISQLPKPFDTPDLVIFHEVYKKEYIALYKECLKKDIPYIVVPHGCLTKNAQKNKYIKKKIGNLLLFKNFVNNSISIHYLAELEKNTSLYNYRKSFVCGNGIDLVEKSYKTIIEPFSFLFMGRYNVFHKGLDILLESVKKLENWFRKNNIKVYLYGMGREKNVKKIVNMIEKFSIEDIVQMNSAIYGEEKEEVFKKSSIFILTSRWEGCPQAIQEALIRGIPCIVSPGTGFAEYIKENNCGYYTDGSVESTCKMIKKAYDDRNNLKELSENGINAMLRDFTWDNIAKKNMDIYAKIINNKRDSEVIL